MRRGGVSGMGAGGREGDAPVLARVGVFSSGYSVRAAGGEERTPVSR